MFLAAWQGIGRGVIVAPALIHLFGYSAHLAQGTRLALVVTPIGGWLPWNIIPKGMSIWSQRSLFAGSCVAGSLLGARLAIGFSEDTARKTFAIVIGMIAVRMFLHKA